jgi:hypothetical protein
MYTRYLSHWLVAALAGVMLVIGGEGSCADAQVFTVDTNQSSITISGSVVGGPITNQGPGSLTGAVGGTLHVALVGGTIQFTGQSQILAEINGNWQPNADGTAGSGPADFGGQANLGFESGFAALRNIQLDVISPVININGGQFDSTNLTFLFPSNSLSSLAYNVTGLVAKHGTLAMTGYATNKVTTLGKLATANNQQTLTIPVNATFYLTLLSPNDTVVTLQGQLVAVQGGGQAPLQVQSVSVQNQTITLQWSGPPGQQFQIQSTTNLGTWFTNQTGVSSASGTYAWTGAITGPVGFYRLAK